MDCASLAAEYEDLQDELAAINNIIEAAENTKDDIEMSITYNRWNYQQLGCGGAMASGPNANTASPNAEIATKELRASIDCKKRALRAMVDDLAPKAGP